MSLEQLIWQGRPGWRGLATGVFGLHWVGLYFAALAAGRVGLALLGDEPWRQALPGAVALLLLGLACLGVLGGLALAVQRTTRYRITDRRVILDYGVALSGTLGIPYGAVAEVALRPGRGGAGDIALRLKPGQFIGFAKLWPHCRPWQVAAPQPMLLAVPEAEAVAALLVRLTREGVQRIASEASGQPRQDEHQGHEAQSHSAGEQDRQGEFGRGPDVLAVAGGNADHAAGT